MSRSNNSSMGHSNDDPNRAMPLIRTPVRKEVLIVEDEAPIAEALAYIIEDAGYAARIAVHGRAALVAIQERRPDLVFTDLMMPFMSGVELIATIRASGDTTLPIILMSAIARDEMRALGADAIIGKPFTVEAIEALLHRYLDA
jgi:DNA-binding response OmpR family regulator